MYPIAVERRLYCKKGKGRHLRSNQLVLLVVGRPFDLAGMQVRLLLLLALLLAACAAVAGAAGVEQERADTAPQPNIVVVLMDDW